MSARSRCDWLVLQMIYGRMFVIGECALIERAHDLSQGCTLMFAAIARSASAARIARTCF
jgi:hypothetical protein